MRYCVEVARYVAFYHPLVGVPTGANKALPQVGNGIIGAAVGPESIGMSIKVSFPYGFQSHAKGFLDNPIVNGGNADGPLLAIGFRDIHPSDRQGFKGCGLECVTETSQVALEISIELAHRPSVDSRRFSSLVGVDVVMSCS